MNADRSREARASGAAVPDGVVAVPVALGQRSYDVLIGTGLLARAADLIDSRLGAAKCVIVTDAECRPASPRPARSRAQGARAACRHADTGAGRGDKELSARLPTCASASWKPAWSAADW